MPRILLLLLLLCSPVLAQDQSPESNNAERDNVIEDQIPRIISILSDLESVLDYYARQAAQDNYPDESIQIAARDLGIQERMAISTEDMAFYAFVALALSVIGLMMLGITLHYTREAASSTRDTLQIAERTLQVTRLNTWVELRPYLSVEDLRFKRINTPNEIRIGKPFIGSGATIGFLMNLKNSGSTPAMNIELGITTGHSHDLFTRVPPDYMLTPSRFQRIGVLSSNSVMAVTDYKILGVPHSLALARERQTATYIQFFFRFLDGFNNVVVCRRTFSVQLQSLFKDGYTDGDVLELDATSIGGPKWNNDYIEYAAPGFEEGQTTPSKLTHLSGSRKRPAKSQ